MNVLMCGAGDAQKLFFYVFLRREMLAHLVNFEKCHSPIHSWPTQTGTVSSWSCNGHENKAAKVISDGLNIYAVSLVVPRKV